MKLFFLFIIILLGIKLSAQSDSTEIKLQRYKDLFAKGLITQQEYDQLKANLLRLYPERNWREAPVIILSKDELEERAANCQKVGVIVTSTAAAMMGVGAIMVGTTVHLQNSQTYSYTYSQYNTVYNYNPEALSASLGIGIALMCASTVLWVVGPVKLGVAQRDRMRLKYATSSLSLYQDIANTASIGYHPSPAIGARFSF